ncbi:Ras family [Pelomyxa schiedti]|nr:Ras family [Pelomyxa schiedti]
MKRRLKQLKPKSDLLWITERTKRRHDIPQDIMLADRRMKVCVSGPEQAGKTSIIERIATGRFFEEYTPTTVTSFQNASITCCGTQTVNLELWDSSGSLRYIRFQNPLYYRGVTCVLLVYDVTNSDGLVLLLQLREECLHRASPKVKLIMCGNKSDVKHRGPKGVTYSQGAQLAREQGFDAFVEVSAKTTRNLHQLLGAIAQLCMEDESEYPRKTKTTKDHCYVM